MRNKIIFAFILTLLVLPFAIAEPEFTFKENTVAEIKVTCLDNTDNPYTAGGTALLTINYPNGNNLIINKSMTFGVPEFNYTLSKSQTLPSGTYTASVFCNTAGTINDGFISFTYDVTPSGNTKDVVWLYIILFVVAYLLTFISAYLENIPLTILGGFCLVLLGLYSLNNGIVIYRSFVTEWFSIITMMIGGYFGVTGGMKLMDVGDSN